ncbi:hypothetical protein JOM56_014114 [Amanita muscaria]
MLMKKNARLLHLRGLYFPVNQASPRPEYIPTVVSDLGRFPIIDALISKNPEILWGKEFVQVREGRGRATFAVFFQYGGAMAVNSCLTGWGKRIRFKGDIIVMKVGKREDFVHLRSMRDKQLARVAVKQFQRCACKARSVRKSGQIKSNQPIPVIWI